MNSAALLAVLRRRALVLLLCLAAGFSSALIALDRTPPSYRASSTLIITLPRASDVNSALQGVQLTAQLLQSYASLVRSRSAAADVRERLGLLETADSIRSKVSAAPQAETLLLEIDAVDPDPVRAQSIANASAVVLIDRIARLESTKQDKIQATVVDTAGLGERVAPRPSLFLLIGLVLGLAVGLAAALLIDALDRTVKSADQLRALLGVPTLGVVPRVREGLSPAAAVDSPQSAAGEAYRALRTAVLFTDVDKPNKTLLVTSPSPGEGKTTTAANLAVALAQSGQRVVLVDADLRRGRVPALLDLPEGAGVTTVITRQASLQECLMGWRDLLTVLGTGPFPPNPSELLGSQAMAALLDRLGEEADIVIIDGAPVLPVTDSVVLAALVDGVVVIARSGRTRRGELVEARTRLSAVNANVVGCVLNAVPTSANRGYYSDYRYSTAEPTRGNPSRVRALLARRRVA